MISQALSLALLAVTATARVIDRLPRVPEGWQKTKDGQPTDPVVLRIALHQQGAAQLEQKVLDVSTPDHPDYGRHLSRNEVRALTAPSDAAVAGVTAWLDANGVSNFQVDNDWITIKTSVSHANHLLDARFDWYRQLAAPGSPPKLRTLSYSVPDDLVKHVDMVQPTTRFGKMAAHRSTVFKSTQLGPPEADQNALEEANIKDATCQSVTPACLQSLYDINYTPSADGNLIGFCSYLDEYARYNDLQSFEKMYKPSAVGQNFTVQLINGGLNDQTSTNDSGEANLDAQYILGVSAPIPIIEYSTGGLGPLVPTVDEPTDSNEPYLDFLAFILDQPNEALPQTLSTSYGEEEQSVPEDYALKVCNQFMQLGARGVSVLFSSGDAGPGGSCVSNTDNATAFGSTFPAGCPYVTAVGATTGHAPESAAAFSSGGFSIYHTRPSWQDSAVTAYLGSIGDTYAAYFNASGRGIPDVSAQGEDFEVFDKGLRALESGTSASCPTFAGVVALLNAARTAAGQPPLGFLNPWIYSHASALTDITHGSSQGCQGNPSFARVAGGVAQWNATPGWDPATGLGTPRFGDLLSAAVPGAANV